MLLPIPKCGIATPITSLQKTLISYQWNAYKKIAPNANFMYLILQV